MSLENLNIGRVCLHEVFRRTDDQQIDPPRFGGGLLALDRRAMDAFASRVVAAFKSSAKCIEMAIDNHGVGSIAAHGAGLIGLTDARFVAASQPFATLLANAQQSRQIPGGLVVVFDGTVGHPSMPFFGIMKAELHEGFLRTNNLQATFVDSLFLTPKTKLYKIGIFIAASDPVQPLPHGWTATVFDSQMTASQRDNAATYFHSTYLGLALPANNAQQVKAFFQKTRDFIKASAVTDGEKVDLYNSLYTYLKVERSPTIQVSEFAERYLEGAVRIAYQQAMRRERFTTAAIQKDLSEVSGSLRIRRLRFRNRITLSGPPEAMADLVQVDSVAGPHGQAWTRITVRGEIEAQE